MQIELDESSRQVILIALAKLSLSRPGWHPACIGPLVDRLGGRWNYEQYRLHGPDQFKAFESPQTFRFTWHANGQDHSADIEAHGFPEACRELGKLHARTILIGGQAPADFRLDFSQGTAAKNPEIL